LKRFEFDICLIVIEILVLLAVPCLRRAVSLEEEYDAAGAEVVLGDDEDGEGWLATHGVQG
jgi:ubiquitin-like-conjugating enzyme ATG3